MSLTAALQIGRTALSASQVGIQVTGNNIANVSTPGYSRQTAVLTPARGDYGQVGLGLGRGVLVQDVRREIDQALLNRLWQSGGGEAGARQQLNILNQLEATLGELGDRDLSSEFASFFNTWSERANQTKADAVVVQQGDKLAQFMRRLRSDLTNQRQQLDGQVGATVEAANQLLQTVATLNGEISQAEINGARANTLRDQRDQAITQLSELVDVTVVDHGPQGVDVLVGSLPVVLGTQVRGMELKRETVNGQLRVSVATKADGQQLTINSGTLGALLNGRDTAINATIDKLDTLASQLAFEVNKLHATGANVKGLTTSTGFVNFGATDQALALNDPNNQSMANLPYRPTNGGFLVRVRESGTGAVQTVRINVDLDGVDSTGAASFADDTSADDIRGALDAIRGIRASFTPDGKLKIDADSGFDFTFAEDSSGVLASLGVNAYFTGTDAGNIAVREDLKADPSRLTTGRIVDGKLVENATALQVARLQDKSLDALGGRTIGGSWQDTAQAVGVAVAGARTEAQAAGVVRQSLLAQRDAVSGVSLDEEAINLLNFQRQYQGAARLISVADELTQTLISLV